MLNQPSIGFPSKREAVEIITLPMYSDLAWSLSLTSKTNSFAKWQTSILKHRNSIQVNKMFLMSIFPYLNFSLNFGFKSLLITLVRTKRVVPRRTSTKPSVTSFLSASLARKPRNQSLNYVVCIISKFNSSYFPCQGDLELRRCWFQAFHEAKPIPFHIL